MESWIAKTAPVSQQMLINVITARQFLFCSRLVPKRYVPTVECYGDFDEHMKLESILALQCRPFSASHIYRLEFNNAEHCMLLLINDSNRTFSIIDPRHKGIDIDDDVRLIINLISNTLAFIPQQYPLNINELTKDLPQCYIIQQFVGPQHITKDDYCQVWCILTAELMSMGHDCVYISEYLSKRAKEELNRLILGYINHLH